MDEIRHQIIGPLIQKNIFKTFTEAQAANFPCIFEDVIARIFGCLTYFLGGAVQG